MKVICAALLLVLSVSLAAEANDFSSLPLTESTTITHAAVPGLTGMLKRSKVKKHDQRAMRRQRQLRRQRGRF